MIDPSIFSRKEDFLVLATLVFESGEEREIPCKVYLPERIYQKPKLVLKPSYDDSRFLQNKLDFSMSAEIKGHDGDPQIKISSSNVYLERADISHWSKELHECSFYCEPQGLQVTHVVGELGDPEKRSEIDFWISDNVRLSSVVYSETSFDGRVSYEHRPIEFLLSEGNTLYFNTRFRAKSAENGDLVQRSYVVGSIKSDISAENYKEIGEKLLCQIDDFLMLVSFVTRRRTACLGWNAVNSNYVSDFYRGNYAFPDASRNTSSAHEEIVDRSEFSEFMCSAHSAFKEIPNKEPIRIALYSAIPDPKKTMEARFLSLFSGLEALILEFRRSGCLEFVLEKKEFKKVRKYLEECIRGPNAPAMSDAQKSRLCSKLLELNRVPLKEAFEAFCNHYSIALEDLWPVFSDGNGISLSDIRNRLIHGDVVLHGETYWAISVALENLTYVVERAIIKVLNGDVGRTTTSKTFLLLHTHAIKDIPQARQSLGRAFEA